LEGGFSLVELMVVLLILGLLVGIIAGSFVFSVKSSQEASCRADLRITRGALHRYHLDHGSFPPALTDLIPDYIDEGFRFTCPESGEDYQYDPAEGEVKCPYHTDF
jgi:prepilin-type N-terminal cleavage/methylation domain-containing protein